jgi:general secretion pathway protein M
MNWNEILKKLKIKGIPLAVTRRERLALMVAGGVIAAFLLIQLVVMPLIEKHRLLNRRLEAQSRSLQEMVALQGEYLQLKRRSETAQAELSRRRPGFTLFSFLDSLAGQTGLKDRIAYMKPSTTTQEGLPYKISVVETKLQGITMKQLTGYLYRVENSENSVRIRRLSITKEGNQQGTVDAVMLVETYEL